MSKKGVSKITGNSAPKTGVTTLYKVAEWYPATPAASRNEALVTWELFKKRADGKFTTTNIKKKGRGEFTFGSKAHLYTYKVEGYLHSPEGVSPMSMVITPQKNDKQPTAEKNILGIKLTYRDGSAVTKTLSYRDQLRATAKCQNLEGKTLVFTLWEDDENGAGHHVKNQKILQSPPILVDRKGYARWDFTLLTTFIALANKREDDKKQHEYYVTAEYNGKMNASGNVNANNPQFKKPPTAVQPKLKPTPNAPKTSTNPASKHNQPDKKGIIRSIKLADKDGNAFTKKPKFGDTISVIIDARNVKGLSYTLRLWEHDNIGDHDLLYNNTHIFKSDLQRALITLTGKMQKIGETGNNPKKPDSGEYLTGNYQEIFAEVIFEKVSAKSAVIDVGIMEEPKKQVTGSSTTMVKQKPAEKISSKCECQQYNLIWGTKVNCDFRKKVMKISKELWPNNYLEMANNLMAVFAWESGGTFKPDAPNQANSGGTGLIQFMPATAKELLGHQITMESVKNYYGKKYNKKTKQKEDWHLDRVKEFADMSAVKQLDYVKKYFESLKGKKLEFVDFYLKVLFPVSSGLPDHVVFADSLKKLDRVSENEKLKNKRVSSYAKNKGMDINRDGKLTKSEIKVSVQKYLTEGLPYSKIAKCETVSEQKSAALTGNCTEGTVVNGFIENHLVIKHKIDSCNKRAMTNDVKIIVLHRTAGGAASGTLTHMKNEGYGAHFVVDYDGTVYQAIGINNRGSHMGVAQFQSTKNAGWGNHNSIGIETCGYSLDKGGNKRVGSKYDKIPHHHWEAVTDLQAKSVACLLKFLLNNLSLSIQDVKVHEKLCSKESNEGQDVYDAMLPYF